jgi:hypothetical protein
MLCRPDRMRSCKLLRLGARLCSGSPPTYGGRYRRDIEGLLRVGGPRGVGREWADVDHRHRRDEVGALVCDVSGHVAVSEGKNMRCWRWH